MAQQNIVEVLNSKENVLRLKTAHYLCEEVKKTYVGNQNICDVGIMQAEAIRLALPAVVKRLLLEDGRFEIRNFITIVAENKTDSDKKQIKAILSKALLNLDI